MNDKELGKYTVSFGIALAITSMLSALLVVVKELNAPLLNLMKQLTGHHWVTHGIFDLIVFVVLGFGLAQRETVTGLNFATKNFIAVIATGVVIGGLIIAGFYLEVG